MESELTDAALEALADHDFYQAADLTDRCVYHHSADLRCGKPRSQHTDAVGRALYQRLTEVKGELRVKSRAVENYKADRDSAWRAKDEVWACVTALEAKLAEVDQRDRAVAEEMRQHGAIYASRGQLAAWAERIAASTPPPQEPSR